MEALRSATLLRNCLRAGLLLLWTSAVIMPIGTYYQIRSPRFEEYQQRVAAEMGARNPGAEVGTAMFVGVLFAVPLMSCFGLLIGLLFTAGTLAVRSLTLRKRDVGLLAAGAFGGVCLIGAVLGIAEGLHSFGWGFNTLGVGYLALAAGLVLGAVGSTELCLVDSKNETL